MRLALAALLLSTTAAASDSASWIRLPPTAMWDAEKIGRADTYQVLQTQRDEAIAKLTQSAAVEIRQDRLSAWAGSEAKCSAGTQPFLLRSVSNGSDARDLQVRVQGAVALVSNGALGRSVQLINRPILACLPTRPDELYVVYSVAE